MPPANVYTEKTVIKMKKYQCKVCNWVYDPATGDPKSNIPAGTPFEQLPQNWRCPICSAGKEHFKIYE